MKTIAQILREALLFVSTDADFLLVLSTLLPADSPQYYMGIDRKKLPADRLWIASLPASTGIRDAFNYKEGACVATVSVWSDQVTTEGGTVREMKGLIIAEQVGEALQTAMNKFFNEVPIDVDNDPPTTLGITDLNIDVDYPYFRASWTFQIPLAI
jgi:hypothetical protein